MPLLIFLFIQFGVFLSYCDCGVTKKPVHVPPELATKIMAAVQKCEPETGIDLNALLILLDGKYRDDHHFKDFIYCTYKTTGFLRKDGNLNEEKAINAFKNEPIVEDGIRRCNSQKQQEENAKDHLFNFFKCFMDTTPVQMTL